MDKLQENSRHNLTNVDNRTSVNVPDVRESYKFHYKSYGKLKSGTIRKKTNPNSSTNPKKIFLRRLIIDTIICYSNGIIGSFT